MEERKCKQGYKPRDGECVRDEDNKNSKNKNYHPKKRLIAGLGFLIFTSILFINNLTQLFQNWIKLTYFQVNLVAWLGIIASAIYAIWLASNKEFD